MAVGGGGVEALFWRGPITPGDGAEWLAPGVLTDSGVPGGGTPLSSLPTGSAVADTDLFYSAQGSGSYTSVKQTALAIKTYIGATGTGMAIGAAVTSGTTGSVLFVDGSGNLAQDNAKLFWDDSGFALNLKAGSNLKLGGSSSGTITVGTQAAAGTWTLKLPTTAGTNLYVLQTDGSGNTSWVAQSGGGGGMAIGAAVTGGTSGSVLFIDGSGNLAQDNANFFWDNTNFKLMLTTTGPAVAGSGLYINNEAGVYVVPNASGNSWFEGGAGNITTTGSQNFGTGDGALSSLTTGSRNTAMGSGALKNCDTGTDNVAFGKDALKVCTSGSNNFGLGSGSLISLTTGQGNVGIGTNSANLILSGQHNTCIGENAGSSFTTSSFNTTVGYISLGSLTSGDQNTCIGYGAGHSLSSGSNNTFLAWTGGPLPSSYNNVIGIGVGANTNSPNLDYRFNTAGVWSFTDAGNPVGLHLYNTTDNAGPPPTNYERAGLEWNLTSNVFRLFSAAGGTGTVRLIAVDGFQKAGAPAAGDLPSGTWALINDTSGGNTWLVYNNAGTIRKVQLT